MKLTGRIWLVLGAAAVIATGVVAFIASGSFGPGGTPAQQLSSWVESAGLGQTIGTLEADNRHVADVISGHKGTSAVHTVCAVLANDAQTANDQLPTPDTAVSQALARAYTFEYDAGEACYHAGASNGPLLTQSARYRAEAASEISSALGRIRAVTGKTLSTTTTTSPGGAVTGIF